MKTLAVRAWYGGQIFGAVRFLGGGGGGSRKDAARRADLYCSSVRILDGPCVSAVRLWIEVSSCEFGPHGFQFKIFDGEGEVIDIARAHLRGPVSGCALERLVERANVDSAWRVAAFHRALFSIVVHDLHAEHVHVEVAHLGV